MRISDWSSDVCSSDLPPACDGPRLHLPVLHAASDGDAQRNLASPCRFAAPAGGPHGRAGGAGMNHGFYIASSYGISALVIAFLLAWVSPAGRARQREIAGLQTAGLRRRSPAPRGSVGEEGNAPT